MAVTEAQRNHMREINAREEKKKKIKKGIFKVLNPLNSLKALNPMTTINLAKKIGKKMHHFTPEQQAIAKEKILSYAVPKMKDYLHKHGITKHYEHPQHLAGQVALVKHQYEKEFQDVVKKSFINPVDYQRFLNTPDYERQLDQYETEKEKAKGFLGFDGEDGSDMSHFVPLIAVAALLKNKKVQGVIKGVGKKVLGAVSKKYKAKQTAKKLQADGEKKVAQAQAIEAGVPANVVAEHTRNLPPETATQVSNDLKDIYKKADEKTETVAAVNNGDAVQSSTMKYVLIAISAAAVLGLIVYFTRKS